jgi:Glyceraldehyde-3-phosphate dehydrogenase/erythrose-4-phosphate dehydrogenase
MARIAINGLGRIGKLVLRDLIKNGAGGDIVLLNEPNADVEQLALLMEFDSVHGRWGKKYFLARWPFNFQWAKDKSIPYENCRGNCFKKRIILMS